MSVLAATNNLVDNEQFIEMNVRTMTYNEQQAGTVTSYQSLFKASKQACPSTSHWSFLLLVWLSLHTRLNGSDD